MIAMAMTATNLAFLFRDLGTSTVIIQRPTLSDSLLASAHGLNMVMGLAIMLALLALARPVAGMYGAPELAGMIGVLSLIFPVSGFGLIYAALIERASDFRQLARIEAVSLTLGLVTSVALALLGCGVWSLVGQMLVSTLATNIQLRLAAPHKVGLALSFDEIRSVMHVGGNVSLSRFIAYFEQNVDSMVIGRVLGSVALATYSMGAKISLFPLQSITWPITRALFPAFSRNQHDTVALRRTYLKSVSVITIVAAPLMTGVYFLRDPLTLFLFGPKWSGIPDVLQWLAPTGFLQAIIATTSVVFLALDRSQLMLRLVAVGCVLQVGSYFIGVQWGTRGVAASFFAANLLNLIPCTLAVMKCLHIDASMVLSSIMKPLLACAVMLMALYWTQSVMVTATLRPVFVLACQTAVGAVAYLLCLTVVLKQDLSDIYAFVRRTG
jgi:PST family polysaccharide transporter